LACLTLPSSVAAAALGDPHNQSPAWMISSGLYDVFDHDEAVALALEYRSGKPLYLFKPIAGFLGTSGMAAYGYAGVGIDHAASRRVYLFPSIVAGVYRNGHGKDLGYPLEFRSGLEIGFRLRNRDRLAVAFYHISNASIGMDNDGTELLMLNYIFELDSFQSFTQVFP
jgi:lipid A 3-O-deacylase